MLIMFPTDVWQTSACVLWKEHIDRWPDFSAFTDAALAPTGSAPYTRPASLGVQNSYSLTLKVRQRTYRRFTIPVTTHFTDFRRD